MQKQLQKISILSVSLMTASAPAINAAIPMLAKHFSTVPLPLVEMLTTIPSLFLIISILFSNRLAQKIGLKQTILLGVTLIVISGLGSALINNFAFIFLMRALLGLGVGLFNSLLVATVDYFYSGQERTQTFGFQSAFEGLGGIIITFIAGQLMRINWQAPFWTYELALPILILFGLFVPNIPKKKTVQLEQDEAKEALIEEDKVVSDAIEDSQTIARQKRKLTNYSQLMKYMLFIFVVAIFYMIIGIKVPEVIVSRNIGTSTDASYVILLLSVGATLAGFAFGNLEKRLKQLMIPSGLLLLGIASILIGTASNNLSVYIAGFITGIGFRLILPYIINDVNQLYPQETAFAATCILVSYNLGTAISPTIAAFLEKLPLISNVGNLFLLGAILDIFLGVIIFVSGVVRKKFR